MRKKEYREVVKNLSEALTEARRLLAESMAMNHTLSVQLAEARKIREDILASQGSQYGEGGDGLALKPI